MRSSRGSMGGSGGGEGLSARIQSWEAGAARRIFALARDDHLLKVGKLGRDGLDHRESGFFHDHELRPGVLKLVAGLGFFEGSVQGRDDRAGFGDAEKGDFELDRIGEKEPHAVPGTDAGRPEGARAGVGQAFQLAERDLPLAVHQRDPIRTPPGGSPQQSVERVFGVIQGRTEVGRQQAGGGGEGGAHFKRLRAMTILWISEVPS